jgi:phosphoribosylformimino-5-aminoimidazole carboxamide ribonucleotide (ProFAR) isomerase
LEPAAVVALAIDLREGDDVVKGWKSRHFASCDRDVT